jgi:hypothetical protein
MGALFVKHNGSLCPADDEAKEALSSIRDGEQIRADVRRLRNLRFHRLFFGLLNLVQANTNYRSVDELLAVVKLGIGHVELVVTPDGDALWLPKSISFAKMDDLEFRRFWNRALDYILQKIIPGTNRADLEQEVYAMLGLQEAA